MRKLITSDVFKMARIIKAAQVKDAISDIFASTKGINSGILETDSEEIKEEKRKALEEKQEAAGFEAIMTVFEACSTEKLENMLYDLIGGISEKDVDTVAKQTLEVTITDIKTIVSENNIANFFKSASQLTK